MTDANGMTVNEPDRESDELHALAAAQKIVDGVTASMADEAEANSQLMDELGLALDKSTGLVQSQEDKEWDRKVRRGLGVAAVVGAAIVVSYLAGKG